MRIKLFFVITAVCFTTSAVQAQGVRIGVYRGISEYDVSGVDQAKLLGLRVGYDFSRFFGVEAGLVGADVEQQFGDTRLYLPDVHLQARLPLGPVAPYLGAGVGLSVETADNAQFGTDTDGTLSAAAGVRVDLPYRLVLSAEGRIRAIGKPFTSSGAEAVIGLAYRFR